MLTPKPGRVGVHVRVMQIGEGDEETEVISELLGHGQYVHVPLYACPGQCLRMEEEEI